VGRTYGQEQGYRFVGPWGCLDGPRGRTGAPASAPDAGLSATQIALLERRIESDVRDAGNRAEAHERYLHHYGQWAGASHLRDATRTRLEFLMGQLQGQAG
jgi:hypothetical protein